MEPQSHIGVGQAVRSPMPWREPALTAAGSDILSWPHVPTGAHGCPRAVMPRASFHTRQVEDTKVSHASPGAGRGAQATLGRMEDTWGLQCGPEDPRRGRWALRPCLTPNNSGLSDSNFLLK